MCRNKIKLLFLTLLLFSACQKNPSELYFISQRSNKTAFIFDRAGNIIHSWKDTSANKNKKRKGWHTAKLEEDGSLFVIIKSESAKKFNLNSKLIFSVDGEFHHDFTKDKLGNYHILARKIEELDLNGHRTTLINEYISSYDRQGKKLNDLNLFSILKELIPEVRIKKIRNNLKALPKPDSFKDIFHANSIDIYYSKPKAKKLNCSDGSFLVSLRSLNQLVIVDPKTKALCWTSKNLDLEYQHHASFTTENFITVFNNRNKIDASEVLLINPNNNQIIFKISKAGRNRFFTKSGGSVQQLKTGGFLVGITDYGEIFEFDRNGDLIWSRLNNFKKFNQNNKFFRVQKIEEFQRFSFLENLKSK